MNIVRVNCKEGPTWGIVKSDKVFTLTEAPYEKLSYDGRTIPFSSCELLAPCVPTKIVCVGKNYYDHVVEMGGNIPDRPILFLKGFNCVNVPEGEIHAPSFVQRLDYEGELAVVIKKKAKDIKAEKAMDYILGFTCLNDVTARDIQSADGQWTRAKSMDGFAPIGPWIVDELNYADVRLETRLNGKTVQQTSTSLFMTKLPQLIEFITASMTLEPGDVVSTGTPSGVGPMHLGDTVEVEVEGIGILRNHVI